MSALPDRSALAVDAAPSTPARVARRPVLQVVRAPEPARSLVPYVLGLVAILVTAMVGALLLNTFMAQTSFAIQAKQVELQQLERHEASLRAAVDTADSPAALQQAATDLGMVPATEVGHLSLADNAIVPTPAQ